MNNFKKYELNQITQLSETVSQSSQTNTTREKVIETNGSILFIPLGFVAVVWMLLLVSRLNFWQSVNRRILPLKKLTKSPCSNCRFYQKNFSLKCAVHPSKVLSKQATDCPDFWSRNDDRFLRS